MATRRRAASKTITGAVTDLQRRVRYLQATTPPSRLATQVVARTNVRPRAINSDQIELAAVTNDQVAADAIRLANMATNSVGESQIVDGSIVNSKVATDAIATGNLQNSSVTEAKLGDSSVTNGKIGNLAVTTGKLADSAVNESKITSSAVTEDKIRNGAVGRSKIQDRAVGTGQIADSAVGTNQIGNSQVTNSKIGGIISGGKIGSGFSGGNINNSSIGNGKLSDVTRARSGSGLRRSGNTLFIDYDLVATRRHTHNYSYGYFTRTRSGFNPVDLTGFNSRTTRTGSASASSKRFKKNIQSARLEDPKKLLQVDFKKFKYKRNHKTEHQSTHREWMYGYIAEELIDLGFEHVIVYDAEGKPEKVDYGLFSALVLELVKVQQNEIKSLQEKIKRMEDKK